jgi:hypothetical protein
MTTLEIFTFTVNNVEIQSRYEKMTALDILEMAAEHGAIGGQPEEYILQSLDSDDRLYTRDHPVDLSVDHHFIALPIGATQVA